jgi:endonuclease YncB( thermonuclease family)
MTSGLAAALVALALATAANAESVPGRVVAIHDGDTLTLLVAKHQVKVRLADIDAPELKQAFGTRSRQSLAALCFNQEARLETAGKDRYGRTIATVHCAGTDANAQQVREGMAWVFERYARRDSPLYSLQSEAQTAGIGLWSDPQPVQPWKWRQEQRAR